MYCNRCGNVLRLGEKFCARCGARVPREMSQRTEPSHFESAPGGSPQIQRPKIQLQDERERVEQNKVVMVINLVIFGIILIAGLSQVGYAFLTYINDITAPWIARYTYTLPWTEHELKTIFIFLSGMIDLAIAIIGILCAYRKKKK